MSDDIQAHFDHFVRFRARYSDQHINDVLARVFIGNRDNPATLLRLSRFCVQLGLVEEAKRFFAAVLQADPHGDHAAAARLGLAALLEREAGMLRRRALEHRRRQAAERPDDPAALTALAEALAAVGRGDGAERWYRRADVLEPGGEAPALGLARLYGDWRQFDAAANVLTAAVERAPRSAALLEALIGIRERQGRPDDLLDACLTALRQKPYNPPVARRLSQAVAAQGWFDAAMRGLCLPDVSALDPFVRRQFPGLFTGTAARSPAGRRVCFVSFAFGAAYEALQARMAEAAIGCGATCVAPWRREDLMATDFYRANRTVLDLRRGAGYWLWKPYIILQALLAAEEGDWVWYHDSGYPLETDITPIIDWADGYNDGYMPGIYLPCYKNREWTKRDCYVVMGCDVPAVWDHCLIQPGWSFWRKSPKTVAIIAEWLKYAVDPRALTDHPNVCGQPNLPEFIDHRHDQSVFTCLFAKLGLTTFGNPDDPLPRYPKDIHFLVERASAFLDAHGRR